MSDLISKQAAVDAILDVTLYDNVKSLRAYIAKSRSEDTWFGGVLQAINAVQDIRPEPERPRGKWIKKSASYYGWMCTECETWEKERTHFCPNCGARMEAEDE
jgi:hypothetical protein